jgi:hypothetical protein
MLGACSLDKQSNPALIAPSGLGVSIDASASPDLLAADGQSQSTITITVRDGAGQLVRDLDLLVTASPNLGTVMTPALKTNSSGVATTLFTAPPFAAADRTTITITPSAGGNVQNSLPRTIQIRLFNPPQ